MNILCIFVVACIVCNLCDAQMVQNNETTTIAKNLKTTTTDKKKTSAEKLMTRTNTPAQVTMATKTKDATKSFQVQTVIVHVTKNPDGESDDDDDETTDNIDDDDDTNNAKHTRPVTKPPAYVWPTVDPVFKNQQQFDPDYLIGGGPCVTNAQCNNNGYCITHQCHCLPKIGGVFCDEKQKSQQTAFLLAFFMGILGAGRFYLGYWFLGLIKLAFGLSSGALTILIVQGRKEVQNGDKVAVKVCYCDGLCSCIFVIWWIIDFAMIANGTLRDVDGLGLYLNM